MKSAPNYALNLPQGHPVRVYFDENIFIQSLLDQLAVVKILKEFRAGTKDEAEFWINFKENEYKGVIEMSQDVTDI